MHLLNIFGILWLFHNIMYTTLGLKNNLFSKLFAPTSYESLDSDLSIPLINEEDLTSLYYEKNASANTNSQSNAINENENIINLLGGFDKKEKYFKDGKFNTTGMVQIIATSFVIETSIYVYYNNWKKWVYIPKDIFTQDFSKINEEKCIYIFASRDKFFNYSLIEDVCD
ncbi:uncharacterized protein LOC126904266 isoform X3 [Daktulosphaira vitifoliae]|uniref:uncharacterized protein LOC126904266 isoform X3 n=1 Tax=Daktulosphaira vitifoliae TaxID=58002 RepID=UPI0021AAB828|nr:uncharacterized protein LOC126904266 isoform X3 [Daktulosphaira vitifoliae]